MTSAIKSAPTILQPEKLSSEKFPITGRSLHLSMEISEGELLACVFDKHSNKYIAFERFTNTDNKERLTGVLKEELFKSTFADVSLSCAANGSVLVPAAFYQKELLNEYLSLPKLTNPKEVPCSDHVKNLDSYNLYTVNGEWLSAVRDLFPNAAVRHHSTIFMEYILTQYKGQGGDSVHVIVRDKFMDVIALQKGALALYNRFTHQNANDFLYYLLWVYEQLKLDSLTAGCTFYGEITCDKMDGAAKYIRTVTRGTLPDSRQFSPPLDKLPAHRYLTLFTQYLCI